MPELHRLTQLVATLTSVVALLLPAPLGAYDELQTMESRLGNLEGAYLQVAERLNGIDHRLEALGVKIDGNFKWTIGIIVSCGVASVGTWITAILAILHLSSAR